MYNVAHNKNIIDITERYYTVYIVVVIQCTPLGMLRLKVCMYNCIDMYMII